MLKKLINISNDLAGIAVNLILIVAVVFLIVYLVAFILLVSGSIK